MRMEFSILERKIVAVLVGERERRRFLDLLD